VGGDLDFVGLHADIAMSLPSFLPSLRQSAGLNLFQALRVAVL
jgi:hypothetical protein